MSMTSIDASRVLTRDEVFKVLRYLKRPGLLKSYLRQGNLVIFRLSCCCGLRVSDIRFLKFGDLSLEGDRPAIYVKNGKGGKKRSVPLWWDTGTVEDIAAWVDRNRETGAGPDDWVLCNNKTGAPLTRRTISRRWDTALKPLGEDRVRQLSIHAGRHSFVSHALASGRTLAEVRDAAGHANVSTTSLYTHVAVERNLPDLFYLED